MSEDSDDNVIRFIPDISASDRLSIMTEDAWPLQAFDLQFTATDGAVLGRLYEEDGILKFEGSLDESARLFFDWIVRHNLSERATAPLPPEYPDAPGLPERWAEKRGKQ